ncbi:lipopolysaccharide biosynthesis protein [Clostridium tyrobutyricum]|uniref:lipopolysaccharide biosynthesis protein n=1 Tax=Clostridium tyrobutyricum TaxID=1519 RepID=UPI001C38E1E6|nr:MATE family efflux transporter [Clostridium tyrobutyricum]MBV4417260.1 MATE family efflux transporter [Clostridium tyrobutyricum]
MGKNKQLIVNMIASFITFGINLGIGFFLTPYIVKTVGSEAYGFVSLANNMINYATVVTIALNSVAGRFITIKVHQGKNLEANRYFTSTFISNIIFSIIIIIIGIPFVWKMEYIINVPTQLILNVKLLFIFVITNFVISILSTVLSVATFITNKLYLSNIVNCIASLLKIALLFGLFGFISPNIAFIGLASCIYSIVILFFNIIFTKKLVPNLKLKTYYFSLKSIFELLSSGIWNTVTKLSQILSDGLDLLISNLWVSTLAMGQLSIAKTVPSLMASLLITIVSVFSPQLTIYYAKNDIKGLVKELKLSMKMSSFFSNIPFSFFVIFGNLFFDLWVPSQDTNILYKLSILSIQGVMVSGAVTVLNNIFLVTNNLKLNSLFWACIGIVDISIVSILLHITNLGVYAVAGVSTSVAIIANLIFVPLYACKCLNIKWNTFYPQIFQYMGTTTFMLAIFYLLKRVIHFPNTWIYLIIIGIISLIFGILINFIMLLNSFERKYLFNKVKEKIVRR